MKIFLFLFAISATILNCQGFQATTTNFNGDEGSCGGCKIHLVKGLAGWAAAATPESMQYPFDCSGASSGLCATGKNAHSHGKVAAGCGSCFHATSTGTNPWGAHLPKVSFNIVVVDSCPYANNKEWCPKSLGQKNNYGYEYHFDLVEDDVNKLGLGDNPIINFSPIDCPSNVVSLMSKNCCGIWWTNQGCPRRTEGGVTFGTCPAAQYDCE